MCKSKKVYVGAVENCTLAPRKRTIPPIKVYFGDEKNVGLGTEKSELRQPEKCTMAPKTVYFGVEKNVL